MTVEQQSGLHVFSFGIAFAVSLTNQKSGVLCVLTRRGRFLVCTRKLQTVQFEEILCFVKKRIICCPFQQLSCCSFLSLRRRRRTRTTKNLVQVPRSCGVSQAISNPAIFWRDQAATQ